MKVSTIASALFCAISPAMASRYSNPACNADNCVRAVTGTQLAGTAIHHADCESFQQCSVTVPAAVQTETLTVTAPATTVTVSGAAPVVRRRDAADEHPSVPLGEGPSSSTSTKDTLLTAITHCPTILPTYASACYGQARYSSACSCFGVTATTTTLTWPVSITRTVTSTLTPTSAVTVQWTLRIDRGTWLWEEFSQFAGEVSPF